MRPALTVTTADGAERRVLADLEGKPWAAQDGEPWHVIFAVQLVPDRGRALELSVAPDITVALRGPDGDIESGPSAAVATRSGQGPDAAPRAKGSAPARRPGARAQDLERLTTRLAAVEAALGREQDRRSSAETSLEGQRTEVRRLSTELGRARAELELAETAQREALETAAQLDGARREIRVLRGRHDELDAAHERLREVHARIESDLRERSGALEAAHDALATERAQAPAPSAQPLPEGPTAVHHAPHTPPPLPRPARPVNPALRSRNWLGRLLALLVIAAIVVVVYLVLTSTVLH